MLSIHCKIALFFFISLFGLSAILKISQRRACALRGVSGCVHLEPRKTNVRRTGERVWYEFVSTVNYTTCIPSLFAQSVGRSIKKRRCLVNPGKQSKLSGVRVLLEDNFCFYSSPISIDLLMLTLIGSFYGESFLEAFSHSSWQINACTRSKLTGNYNTTQLDAYIRNLVVILF